MFWKKKEALPDLEGFSESAPPNMSFPEPMHSAEPYPQPEALTPQEQFSPPTFRPATNLPLPQAPQYNQQSQDKDLALINSKLDTLKAQLDYLIQRLDKMEQTLKPKW